MTVRAEHRTRADSTNGGIQSATLGVAGLLVFFSVWEVIGRAELFGSSWPPLSRVVAELFDPHTRLLLASALLVTSFEAALGYVFGAGTAFLSGVLGVFLPPIQPGLLRLAVVVHAIPVVALAPVLISLLPLDLIPAALASLAVYFTTLVATTTGFSAPRPAHDDLLTILGAQRRERFRHLLLPAALPVIVDGLKLAAPAAVLGAIIGEWLGAPKGLGPVLVAAMGNLRYQLLWATALTGVTLSLAAFGLLSLVHRQVVDRYE
jgi:ABC-type nitrate/sulfonate/bicarbonate transport system permease component